MITSKQRAYLRGLGQSCPAIMQIGKGGLSENLLKTVSDALEARELVKLSVLENAAEAPIDLANALAESLDATVVCVIGRKIVLYRYSLKPGVTHIEY